MPVNLYETRTMMAAIEQKKPVRTFLKDTFFKNTSTFLTEKVDVDVKKGKRKMAPFVAPRVGGILMSREGFETNTLATPRIAPERILTIDDINRRSMGENIYSTLTPEQRAAKLLATDLIELDEYIARREEWMCRELIINGKIEIKEETRNGQLIEKEVDYQFSNKKVLTGDNTWDNDKSDPIKDLKDARREIIKKAGTNPNIIIMASDVIDRFLQHPKVEKMLNILNVNRGKIEPSINIDGTTFYGKIPEIGEIYTYDEWFLDDDGKEQPMIPDGMVILAVSDLGSINYGAVTQMENKEFTTYEGKRVPKKYSDEENETMMLRLTSRPLPSPKDVDSWYIFEVM